MNHLGRALVPLAVKAAEIVDGDGGDLIRLDAGVMADGSERPFVLVTSFQAGLEQVYRIAAPAPASAPGWAAHSWTTEVRVGDSWKGLGEERTLCPVHEAGACPPSCEHAYSYEERLDEPGEPSGPPADSYAGNADHEPPPEPRSFDVLERQEDGSWEVVGKAIGRTDWDALVSFKRDLHLEDAVVGRGPSGHVSLARPGEPALRARPGQPSVADLLGAARLDTVDRLFELLRLFGIEGVAAGAIRDAKELPFKAIADAAEGMANAASAAMLLAEPEEAAGPVA